MKNERDFLIKLIAEEMEAGAGGYFADPNLKIGESDHEYFKREAKAFLKVSEVYRKHKKEAKT